MTRKAVLSTFGTLGDLHPFIALAVAMRDHGFQPVIACAAEYKDKVEAAGIAFFPVRPSFAQIERDLGMDRPELTRRAVARSDFLFRSIVLPYVRESYEDAMAATADADLVLTSSLAFGARLAAEKRGISWVSIVLQPMMFFSACDPPVLPKAAWITTLLRRLGPRATAAVFAAAQALFDPMFSPVHRVRAEIGLPRTARNPFFAGQYSSAGAIGLYSGLLGEVQPDHPVPTTVVGFAAFDSEDGRDSALQPQLRRWLESGGAPLVFTLGSLLVHSPGGFYRSSIAAARLLKRRALLLVGEDFIGDFAAERGDDVFVGAYAPHSKVFPLAAAVIHHGGIGTLAQALRSGRPQLIVPFYADQPDNAARAVRLGVARVLAPSRYRATTAARALAELLADAGVLARAGGVSATLAHEDGAVGACRLLG